MPAADRHVDHTFPALRQALALRYDLQRPIGRGGMGIVYLARERALDRAVAIKVLNSELSSDAACRERFLREARTAAGLSHPHIVPVFAVDEAASGNFVMFAMPHVAGETLAARVARLGPLAPQDAARMLVEIGDALAYAHGRGVVHRDVKPDNILIDGVTGRALLSDFGIAQVVQAGRPEPARAVIGTAAFMSPEQARGAPVDRRSDLYSLGVVAFHALSGHLPFQGPSDAAQLALHIAEAPSPLADVAPHVPAGLAAVVDRCLAKDPWARFPDARAFVNAVAAAVQPPPAPLAVRAFVTRTRGIAAITTLRRLARAGHSHAEVVAALEQGRARRVEELRFLYGAGPTPLERALSWLARVATLTTLVGMSQPEVAALAGAVALLAAVLARARTRRRTDPRGARRLRFWRGPMGRLLFRIAAVGLRRAPPIVTIIERS